MFSSLTHDGAGGLPLDALDAGAVDFFAEKI